MLSLKIKWIVEYMITRLIQVCVLQILMSVLIVANAETILLDEKNHFRESYAENVNISGSVRVGVMYGSSELKVTPDSLYINIGLMVDQMLCVKMLSVDGQYGADFSYQLTGNVSGRNRFQIPTKLRDVLTGYAPDQLVVLAEIKSKCKGRSGVIVPALWGGQTQDTVVKVYLNSGVSKTVLKLYKNEGGSKKLECGSIKAVINTAYDTECSIVNISSYNLEKTKIIRTHFGNYSKPVKLKIHVLQGH